VHVTLRRREFLMSGQFLNRSCRRAAHRQMRTERVAQHVPSVIDTCPSPKPLRRCSVVIATVSELVA
jgi:hypothetical protein